MLTGQGNSLMVDYMIPTLYYTISANPYMATSEPGMNPTYPLGAKTVARDNIKYN